MSGVKFDDTIGTTDQEWDEPTPLSIRPPLPTFPVEALPGWLAEEWPPLRSSPRPRPTCPA